MTSSTAGRPAVDVARAAACLFVADGRLDQVQQGDQPMSLFRDPECTEGTAGPARRDGRRLRQWALLSDKCDGVVKMHCVKAQRHVGRAAFPVPGVRARTEPARFHGTRLAMPGAKPQGLAAMGSLNAVSGQLQGGPGHRIGDRVLDPCAYAMPPRTSGKLADEARRQPADLSKYVSVRQFVPEAPAPDAERQRAGD